MIFWRLSVFTDLILCLKFLAIILLVKTMTITVDPVFNALYSGIISEGIQLKIIVQPSCKRLCFTRYMTISESNKRTGAHKTVIRPTVKNSPQRPLFHRFLYRIERQIFPCQYWPIWAHIILVPGDTKTTRFQHTFDLSWPSGTLNKGDEKLPFISFDAVSHGLQSLMDG